MHECITAELMLSYLQKMLTFHKVITVTTISINNVAPNDWGIA